jgi:hypothetical protein
MAETKLEDFENIFSLKDRVVVVTGGSRGLGLHAASGYLFPGPTLRNLHILNTSSPDSSKPAPQKSTSPLAKHKPATLHAQPSMPFPTSPAELEQSASRLTLAPSRASRPSFEMSTRRQTMLIYYLQMRVLRGVKDSIVIPTGRLERSWI